MIGINQAFWDQNTCITDKGQLCMKSHNSAPLSHACCFLIADIIDQNVPHKSTEADLGSLHENGDNPSFYS